jgi:hypothetical protein
MGGHTRSPHICCWLPASLCTAAFSVGCVVTQAKSLPSGEAFVVAEVGGNKVRLRINDVSLPSEQLVAPLGRTVGEWLVVNGW